MKASPLLLHIFSLCACATLAAISMAGCVVVPIPTPQRDTGYARTNLTTLTPRQFTQGQSTRKDVILALGEPDAVSADEHEFAYRSERTVAYYVAAWYLPGIGGINGGEANQERLYVFDFDSQGRLQKVTQTKTVLSHEEFDTFKDSLNLPKNEHSGETTVSLPLPGEGNTNDVPACLTGERVWRIYPNASWFVTVNGFQGPTSLGGEPGWLVLTESNLVFLSRAGFANNAPALKLPLASVAAVYVDKKFLVQRLVVRIQSGQFHSFEIHKTGGVRLDKAAMQAACEFIEAKIKPTQLKQ